MNVKRWGLATAVGFVVVFAAEFVIHQLWLSPVYKAHPQWWRPEAEMQSLMHLMLLAQLSFAALLSLVYAKGYEASKGGVAQGVRFGVLIGCLLLVPNSLMSHVIYPYPASLILSWFVGGMAETMLVGAAIGAIYRPPDAHH
jgi:hypothetical protein